MYEIAPQFSTSPKDVFSKLKDPELKSKEPGIINLSWLNEAKQLADEEIIKDVFRNNEMAAEFFFERRAVLEIRVFQDPEDQKKVYIVTSKEKDLVTVLKTDKQNLHAQIEIFAKELFVSSPSMEKAIAVSSLFPSNNESIKFAMLAYLRDPDKKGQKQSAFGFDARSNTLCIDQIVDEDTLTSLCHEIGHIWAEALGIDVQTLEKIQARKNGYDVNTQDWEVMSKGVSEVLFSERVANIIGKIIADKILKNNIFSDSVTSLFSREWRDKQEFKYDEHYLNPAIAKFPELSEKIKSYFISRKNRVKN